MHQNLPLRKPNRCRVLHRQSPQSDGRWWIKNIINRFVIRWPHGLGVECVDTECFILLSNDNDMEALIHYFDGYHFHNNCSRLKAEWGWFTFRIAYHPLATTRPCSKCDNTFRTYVRSIEDKLLNEAIQARIKAINTRNQQQRQELFKQQQLQNGSTNIWESTISTEFIPVLTTPATQRNTTTSNANV